SGNTVGGTTAGARNVISGNQVGVVVAGDANVVQGNHIGTDVSGTLDRGNAFDGIIGGGQDNLIGGTTAGAGNLISGNGGSGVLIDNARGNVVQGNVIGLQAGGVGLLGNDGYGVYLLQAS